MKTKDRIVYAALDLFNQHGERSVTTNHIAAHMQISPGNLYYHYRNKSEIIARIFDRYKEAVDDLFVLPHERPPALEDRNLLIEKLLEVIWQYRFFHRDLIGMLENDSDLGLRYQAFADKTIANGEEIYRKMRDAGLMLLTDDQIRPLSLNVWILLTSWTTYLLTARGVSEPSLSKEHLSQVIYQMSYLEMPYMTENVRQETRLLLAQFAPCHTLS